MHKIRVEDASLTYPNAGARVPAVEKACFSVRESEFVCLLGPSGCGKSTLLHLLAGFIRPDSGKILVDNRPVAGPGVDRGVVFQRHSLFPWMTVWGNVEFGLQARGVPAFERRAVVARYLLDVGLSEFSASYPGELSMGQQQRVGLARALANDPEILLMDEPFGSLDALTRLRMQDLLLSIYERHSKTIVFVTHDIDESIVLASRVLLLSRRPARILEDLAVDLPRPRRTHDTLTCQAFLRLKGRILDALEG
jgi:ABC-type nitrate/sulfonate/bicarbonate transport system ATPase subunit